MTAFSFVFGVFSVFVSFVGLEDDIHVAHTKVMANNLILFRKWSILIFRNYVLKNIIFCNGLKLNVI